MLLKISRPLLLYNRAYSLTLSSIISPQQKEYFPDIGNREIVGYGFSGKPEYEDTLMFPYPAIRWKSYNDENWKLKLKEQGEWKILTMEEKKELYRLSFRQTLAELIGKTPNWKYFTAHVLVFAGVILLVLTASQEFITKHDEEMPTFTKEAKYLQMYRHIYEGRGRIDGIGSKWDFDNLRWKE